MSKFRRILSSLGVRLAAGFALIAMISAAATGAVLFLNARDNVLRAEQDRLLTAFNADFDKMPTQVDLSTSLSLPHGAPADVALLSTLLANIPGATLELPETGQQLGGFLLSDIPQSFRDSVSQNPYTSAPRYLRIQEAGTPTFIMGRATFIQVDRADLLPPELLSGTSTTQLIKVVMYSTSSLYAQQEQMNSLTNSAIWLTVVVGIGAAAVGVLLARQLVRPVKSLRSAVQDLGSTGEATPLTAKGISELSGLIDSFNTTSAQLHAIMTELTESETRARRFVSDVSHELRTPLTAMVASAEVLENPAASRASTREAARLTVSSARRLAKMTEDLLEISRFDAGHVSVQFASFDAAERLADLANTRDWPKTVTLIVDGPLPIETDPRRWDVIIGNLVGNALKHGAAPVEIRAGLNDAVFYLEVRDCGIGIPPADQQHIFERFFKADSSRSAEGTGLGLALVAENCALLGGTVSVASSPGSTSFLVKLPARSTTDSQL